MAHRHPAGCQRLGRFSLAVVADLDDAASATFAPTSVSSQIGFSLVAAFGWYLSRDCVLDFCAGVSGSRVWSPFARVSVAAAGPRSLSCSGWCAAATRSLMPPAPGFRDGAPISTKGASARRRSGWRSGEPSGPGPSYLMSCGIGSRQQHQSSSLMTRCPGVIDACPMKNARWAASLISGHLTPPGPVTTSLDIIRETGALSPCRGPGGRNPAEVTSEVTGAAGGYSSSPT